MKFDLEHYRTLKGTARKRFKQAHNYAIMSRYSLSEENPHHIETETHDETLIQYGKRRSYGGLSHAEVRS